MKSSSSCQAVYHLAPTRRSRNGLEGHFPPDLGLLNSSISIFLPLTPISSSQRTDGASEEGNRQLTEVSAREENSMVVNFDQSNLHFL
jgi:hypothetical protein